MEPAIDRIMTTYDLLLNRSAAASAEARAKVTDYLTTLVEAGEKDTHRLTVCGLIRFLARARRLQRSGEGGFYGAVGLPQRITLCASGAFCATTTVTD